MPNTHGSCRYLLVSSPRPSVGDLPHASSLSLSHKTRHPELDSGACCFSSKDAIGNLHHPYGPYEKYFKRPLDILCALGALVFFWWLFAIIAILVRIKLGSPVLFTQERPGKDEKIFKLYKFRTMTDERDKDGKLLPDEVRLTKFGKFLRSTSLDELPEIFNILKGEMSVVGPRPLAVVYLSYYTEYEHARHNVRPGLTGLAQVNGRNSLSWEKKFEYDVKYVNSIRFVSDLKIVLWTVKKVFIREGIGQGKQHPGSLHEIRAHWLDKNGQIKQEYL